MLTTTAAHEIYRTQMAEAKLRILSTEKILTSTVPATGYVSLDLEFCFLQIRLVIELVTFGAMIREELRYATLRSIEKCSNNRDHGNAAKDWQAPEILKRLVSISPYALPIPYKDGKQISPGLIHFDRIEIGANHARLIDLYTRSGGFLHAKNPVDQDFPALVEAQRTKYVAASSEARRAVQFLRQLLWRHAAVTLEPTGENDPRTPAGPKQAWLVNFGSDDKHDVIIELAEAVES